MEKLFDEASWLLGGGAVDCGARTHKFVVVPADVARSK